MKTEYALIALGANLGDRREWLCRAIAELEKEVEVLAESSVYETAAVGVASRDFHNMVLVVRTSLEPEELLALAKRIERDLGRTHRQGLVDREIDIDVLTVGDERRDCRHIVLPHPRMTERAFVLAPLAEIVPRWRHPVVRRRYEDLFRDERETNAFIWGLRANDGLRHHSPAPHPHRAVRIRSCARETAVFTVDGLTLEPQAVSAAFRHDGRIIIKDAVDAREIEGFSRDMADLLAETARSGDRSLRRGDAYDGYTPPNGEGVTGKGPDPLRHFWDITDVGGKLEDPLRRRAMCIREALIDVGMTCLSILDPEDERGLVAAAEDAPHPLRVMRYINAVNDGSIMFPEHKDWDFATVHVGGAKPGIEVLDQDGVWIEGDIGPGDVLFFPGSALSLYGADLPKALLHRVRAVSVERTSVIAWIVPGFDVTLPNGETVEQRYARLMKHVRHAPAKD